MHDIATTTGHLNSALKGGVGIYTVTADGAIPLNYDVIVIDSTAGALALTLADGAPDQKLEVRMSVDGGDAVVTYNGTATATFADANDALYLVFDPAQTNWVIDLNVGSVAIA